MKVHGKVWVVTGGGSGMGRELVVALLQRGARVAAVDVRADALAQTVAGRTRLNAQHPCRRHHRRGCGQGLGGGWLRRTAVLTD